MSKVAVVKCEGYEYEKVKNAVEKGIGLLGGPSAFVKPGERILLKPNLLSADPPERCATTHPSVFKAVGEILMRAGGKLSYGDSPGLHSPKTAAKKAGIADVADELGIGLADFQSGEEIVFREGLQNKRFVIAKGVIESDGLISLPKLKTHALEKMTGCVKNQFGCVPGKLKGEFHVRIPDVNDFARMLVDLNNYIKPRLYVMDGIMAMEGNGPRSGNPKKMDLLIFSSDPIALDATVCRIVNLDPGLVPTIKYGSEAGMGTYLEKDIEILGDGLSYFKDFDVIREPLKPYRGREALQFLKNYVVPRPYINGDRCVKCGVCVTMCPVNPKAVDWHNGVKDKPPVHIYNRCIRCYCCQELCPEGVIGLKVPLIRRLLSKRK